MLPTLNSYLSLFPSASREHPRFMALAEAILRQAADLITLAADLQPGFSLARAEGVQLDALADAMGLSRRDIPGQPDPGGKVLKKAVDIFMADCELLAINDLQGLLREEAKVNATLNYLDGWIAATRQAMAGAVQAEGAVL